MKIQLTNPISGRTTTHRCNMSTERAECHYGQPVAVIDGDWVLDLANAVMQGARILNPPRQRRQQELLAQWQASAKRLIGEA